MTEEWTNWSGSIRFTPSVLKKPKNEGEVRQIIVRALEQKKKLRIAGAAHSSVPLVQTDQILIDQENLNGIISHDKESKRVKILPGIHIAELGKQLEKRGLSMHNTGDVDFQRISGAFAKGTHGSGISLQNLSGMLVECRLIDGRGELRAYTQKENPEMMNALRVSLGALGFFTELTINSVN